MRGDNAPFHSQRISEYTNLLAEHAGVPETEQGSMVLGGSYTIWVKFLFRIPCF